MPGGAQRDRAPNHLLGRGACWHGSFHHTPGALAWLLGRLHHDLHAKLVHHLHIALRQRRMHHTCRAGYPEFDQLVPDLLGVMSVVGTGRADLIKQT